MNELLGEDIEFRQIGHLRLARSEAEMQVLEDYASTARDYGLHLQLNGGAVTREMFPFTSENIAGSSLSVECGHANPRIVTPAFSRAARAQGAIIREFCPVEHCSWTGSGFETVAKDVTVTSEYLVNASGAWALKFVEMFGETAPMTLRTPNLFVTEPAPYFLTKSIAVVGGKVYFRQVERGNVILGGGPGWGDLGIERSRNRPETMLGQFSRAVELVPEIAGLQIIRSWSGLEGDFADKLPVIGPSLTTPNLIHAFGLCGHGFQLGPAIGEILCEMIVDGQSETPIDAFCISRFDQSETAQNTRAG